VFRRLLAVAGLETFMPARVGHVEAIFRYPGKSMGGERLEVAEMGWHAVGEDLGTEVGRRYGAPVRMMLGHQPALRSSDVPAFSPDSVHRDD
jgi:hypothetical protein